MNRPLNPFSAVRIPGIRPDVDYCLYRVDRGFDGLYEPLERTEIYECRHENGRMKTQRLKARLTWRITTSLTCNEVSEIWPTTQLTAVGTVIRRRDGLALFSGRFRIFENHNDQPQIPYFYGRMELIARNGSHQAIGEACDPENHIEGWLIGRGVLPMRNYSLRAAVVIAGELPATTVSFPLAAENRLTGVLVKRS